MPFCEYFLVNHHLRTLYRSEEQSIYQKIESFTSLPLTINIQEPTGKKKGILRCTLLEPRARALLCATGNWTGLETVWGRGISGNSMETARVRLALLAANCFQWKLPSIDDDNLHVILEAKMAGPGGWTCWTWVVIFSPIVALGIVHPSRNRLKPGLTWPHHSLLFNQTSMSSLRSFYCWQLSAIISYC